MQHALLALRTFPGVRLGREWQNSGALLSPRESFFRFQSDLYPGWRARKRTWEVRSSAGTPGLLSWLDFGADWLADLPATQEALAALTANPVPCLFPD